MLALHLHDRIRIPRVVYSHDTRSDFERRTSPEGHGTSAAKVPAPAKATIAAVDSISLAKSTFTTGWRSPRRARVSASAKVLVGDDPSKGRRQRPTEKSKGPHDGSHESKSPRPSSRRMGVDVEPPQSEERHTKARNNGSWQHQRRMNVGPDSPSCVHSPADIRSVGRGELGLSAPPVDLFRENQDYSPARPRAFWRENWHMNGSGSSRNGDGVKNCCPIRTDEVLATTVVTGKKQREAQQQSATLDDRCSCSFQNDRSVWNFENKLGASGSQESSGRMAFSDDTGVEWAGFDVDEHDPATGVGLDAEELVSSCDKRVITASARPDPSVSLNAGDHVMVGSSVLSVEKFALLAVVAMVAFSVGTCVAPSPYSRPRGPPPSAAPRDYPARQPPTANYAPTVFEMREKRRESLESTLRSRAEEESVVEAASIVKEEEVANEIIVGIGQGIGPGTSGEGIGGQDIRRPILLTPVSNTGDKSEDREVQQRVTDISDILNEEEPRHEDVESINEPRGNAQSRSSSRSSDDVSVRGQTSPSIEQHARTEAASCDVGVGIEGKNGKDTLAMSLSHAVEGTDADQGNARSVNIHLAKRALSLRRRRAFDHGQAQRAKPPAPQRTFSSANPDAFARTLGVAQTSSTLFSRGQSDKAGQQMWRVSSSKNAARAACEAIASSRSATIGPTAFQGDDVTCDTSVIWKDVREIASTEISSLPRGEKSTRPPFNLIHDGGTSKAVATTDGMLETPYSAYHPAGGVRFPAQKQETRSGLDVGDTGNLDVRCRGLVLSGSDIPSLWAGRYSLVVGEDAHEAGTPAGGATPFLVSPFHGPVYWQQNMSPRFHPQEGDKYDPFDVEAFLESDKDQGMEQLSPTDHTNSATVVDEDESHGETFVPVEDLSLPEEQAVLGCSTTSPPVPEQQHHPTLLQEPQAGGLCLYWADVGGGRWVLDDDTSVSNGVFGVTTGPSPAAAHFSFSDHAVIRQWQQTAEEKTRGLEGTASAASPSRTSWLFDSPWLQGWVAADNVLIECKVD